MSMERWRRWGAGTLMGWMLVHGSGAAMAAADELGPRIRAMVGPYVQLGDFSGTILVAERGEILSAEDFGYADVELEVSNTTTTRFLIGSMSKQFTAAAVLLLEERDLLRVTDPVSRFIPDYPRGDQITLHHLLTHTAGIPDIYALEGYPRLKHADPSLEDVVALFRDEPLQAEPGTGYAYSNSGYTLLAYVIEQVSGQRYAEFLQQHIFDPLEMHSSGAPQDRTIVPGLATGYDPSGQTDLRRATQVAPALLTGSGSIYSSAEDLLRWDRALSTGGLLSPDSTAKMETDHGTGYGYGVSVFRRFDSKVIEHDGRLPGFASDLARYPERGLVVIILANIQSAVRDRFRDDIAAILHGQEVSERKIRTAATGSVAAVPLHRLEGTYSFGPNFFVAVRAGTDRLFLRANHGEESEFFPVEAAEFFSRVLYAGARFERDETGGPAAMEYIRGARSFRGKWTGP